MFRILTVALVLTVAPLAALADDVTDTLDSAIQAYNEGDLDYALEEIAFATQLIKAKTAGKLNGFLPEAQAGWERTIDEEQGRALGMMGGTGAVATYSNGAERFTIQIVADSPMVASFAGIFGNAAMMATMGKIERVGREKFLNQDGNLTGVVGNRILVQADGTATDTMLTHLETMDFKGLQGFGS